MARRFSPAQFRAIAQVPNDQTRADWLSRADDSVAFLQANAASDDIILYANTNAVLIHAVLAPTKQVTPPDYDDLLRSFVQSDDSWRIQRSYGGGEGHRVYIEPALSSCGCNSLVGGEKLIYRRSFAGVKEGGPSIEISQKLVHCFDLHFVPSRNAYCRLDEYGDIEDVIRILNLESMGDGESGIAVTMLTADLFAYMALTDTVLVSKFDFTRFVPGAFTSWRGQQAHSVRNGDLFYDAGVVGGNASYANGCLISRPSVTVDDLVEEWKRELDPKNREYEKFKIFDRKNGVEIETSCAPDCLSNYFQKSDLPWEISPAFFRADVLHRFKADPEKYTLGDRSITCRGAWHLKTYDINEAGQVHTYIGYLANLPIEEQRYWRSFNEWPKSSISQRAFQTDILGEWSTIYDPLNHIKMKVRSLDEGAPAWWKPRGEELMSAVRYPATESTLEWGNEILALDQLIVEGFLVAPLRAMAGRLGRNIEAAWASLKVLQECMLGVGQTEDDAKAIIAPLQKLHALRSRLRGHAAVSAREEAEQSARSMFGSLRGHFKALAAECDNSLEQIVKALKQG